LAFDDPVRVFDYGLSFSVKVQLVVETFFVGIYQIHMFRSLYEPSVFVFGASFKERAAWAGLGFIMFYPVDGLAACLVVPTAIGSQVFFCGAGVSIQGLIILKALHIEGCVGCV